MGDKKAHVSTVSGCRLAHQVSHPVPSTAAHSVSHSLTSQGPVFVAQHHHERFYGDGCTCPAREPTKRTKTNEPRSRRWSKRTRVNRIAEDMAVHPGGWSTCDAKQLRHGTAHMPASHDTMHTASRLGAAPRLPCRWFPGSAQHHQVISTPAPPPSTGCRLTMRLPHSPLGTHTWPTRMRV